MFENNSLGIFATIPASLALDMAHFTGCSIPNHVFRPRHYFKKYRLQCLYLLY